MAGININMSLQDAGTIKQKTGEAKTLNAELGKTTKLAQQALAPQTALSNLRAKENEEYGRVRGSVGTGAAGRDFANQAQGLGGLVRLYATYAANLFAVGAAFRSLSNAMDTTNMVEGLNQLGAASGVALGTLAKRFADASGGAISLRESMEATTKAISSGLSEKQFIQLGEVAKNASQALGVNMSDAVSRLTRGITKLEPELLDELGIFTKVGKATDDYAKSIGKSAAALTDFERRQAFANAVLEEGQKKFSEIDIPTNPYAKLLATLKDIAQTGLAGVNKALGPIVDLLSSSPTALTAIMAGLGVTLVRQAIPALGEYRKGLEATAERSRAVASERAVLAKSALDTEQAFRAKTVKAELDAIAEIKTARVDEAADNLKRIAKSNRDISKGAKQILATPDILDISEKQLSELDKLGAKQTNLAGTYRQLAGAIREAKKANEEYIATEERLNAQQNAAPGRLTAAGIAARRAESARRAAESRSIISEASNQTGIVGPLAALKDLNSKTTAANLGMLTGTFTRVAGAANIAATAIMGIVGAIQLYIFAAVAVVTGIKFLVDWMSNTEEEGQRLTKSIEETGAAAKVSADTFKRYGDDIGFAAVAAKTTAFSTLAESINESASALVAFNEKANLMSRFKQSVLRIFGQDFETEVAESISDAITKGLNNIVDPELKKKVQADIKELIGGRALDDISGGELQKVAKGIASIFTSAGRKGTSLNANLTAVADGFKELDTAYTALSNSLLNKDVSTTFAVELIKQSSLLAKSLESPTERATVLAEILKDTSKIKMFPPETQVGVMEMAKQMKLLEDASAKAKAELQDAVARANNAIKQLDNPNLSGASRTVFIDLKVRAEEDVKRASMMLQVYGGRIESINKNLETGFKTAIASGFKLMEAPLVAAMAKGSIDVQKTLLDKLPKTSSTIEMAAKLDIQSIEIDKQQLTKTQDLINALERNRLSMERIALEEQKQKAVDRQDMESIKALNPQIESIKNQEKALSSRNISQDIKAGNITQSPEVAAIFQRQIGMMTKLAEFSSKQEQVRVGAAIDKIAIGFDKQASDIAKSIENLDTRFKRENRTDLDPEAAIILKQRYEAEKQIMLDNAALISGPLKAAAVAQGVIDNAKGNKGIATEGSKALTTAKEEEVRMRANQESNRKATEIENARLNLQRSINIELTKQGSIEEGLAQRREQQVNLTNSLNDIALERLNFERETGSITAETYEIQINAINASNILRNKENALNAAEEQFLAKKLELQKELNAANGNMSADYLIRKQNAEAYYKAEVDGINAVAQKQQELLAFQTEYTQKQRDMGKVVEDSFQGMADALVEFAKTGKISFQSLIADMLAGILKVELQAQMSQAFSGLKTGIMGAITAFFPAAGAGAGAVNGSAINWTGGNAALAANGAYFDGSISKFAQGGTFTNKIVDSPTMFKFAQGTGLMGEAGPEAIMPLKRDANGTLGVRANAANNPRIDVQVNNYSGAKAETKETVDSRGNRKIEVVIGEMVADEVNRSGSAVNKSLRGTFGTQPALIRR